MAHDGPGAMTGEHTMTNQNPAAGGASNASAPWVPLESGGAAAARRPPAPRNGTVRQLRLRRSRSPVIAALDGGGDVFQRRGRDLLVAAAILIAPMLLLNLWATILVFDRLDGSGPSLPGFNDDATTGVEELTVLVALVVASLTAAVVGVFAATILVGERFGSPVGLRQGLWSTVRRLPAATVGWALGHWWLLLADAWLVGARGDQLVGRLLLVAPVVACLSVPVLFVVPVLVAEHVGPLRALRRSWRLARMRFGAAFGFVIASSTVGGLLMVGLATLPALLEWSGFVTFGGYTWLAQGVAAQVGALIVVPLVGLATAQMYLEVRLDAEGMDIMIDADAAFGRRGVA